MKIYITKRNDYWYSGAQKSLLEFPERAPSFHYDKDCELLKSDYKNIIVNLNRGALNEDLAILIEEELSKHITKEIAQLNDYDAVSELIPRWEEKYSRHLRRTVSIEYVFYKNIGYVDYEEKDIPELKKRGFKECSGCGVGSTSVTV